MDKCFVVPFILSLYIFTQYFPVKFALSIMPPLLVLFAALPAATVRWHGEHSQRADILLPKGGMNKVNEWLTTYISYKFIRNVLDKGIEKQL